MITCLRRFASCKAGTFLYSRFQRTRCFDLNELGIALICPEQYDRGIGLDITLKSSRISSMNAEHLIPLYA